MSITDIINPEIKNDEFYHLIMQVASQAPLKQILEIGSSSGGGSTEAWAKGIEQNPNKPKLHCLELSKPRFEKLKTTYINNPQINCHWCSSIPIERFPTKEEVAKFYEKENSRLRNWSLMEVFSWLDQDLDYIKSSNAPSNGIKEVLLKEKITCFDAVLIDGSEFIGAQEFAEIYGATFILLDDTMTYKTFYPNKWLKSDPNYQLLYENENVRNGFSLFRRT